jgi:hypothetical protein
MAYNSYLEGLAAKAYSETAATELATVPPYGTDREVCTLFTSKVVSNMHICVNFMYSCP